MKAKIYLIIIACSFISFKVVAQQPLAASSSKSSSSGPESTTDAWYSDAASWIKTLEYGFHPAEENTFRVSSPSNRVAFIIHPQGYIAYPMKLKNDETDWATSFSLQSIGRNESSFHSSAPLTTESTGNKLVQHFGFADVEYTNDAMACVRILLSMKIPGKGRLKVRLSLQSGLKASLINGQKLVHESGSGDKKTRLLYEDLKVWDADQQPLRAHMESDEEARN